MKYGIFQLEDIQNDRPLFFLLFLSTSVTHFTMLPFKCKVRTKQRSHVIRKLNFELNFPVSFEIKMCLSYGRSDCI